MNDNKEPIGHAIIICCAGRIAGRAPIIIHNNNNTVCICHFFKNHFNNLLIDNIPIMIHTHTEISIGSICSTTAVFQLVSPSEKLLTAVIIGQYIQIISNIYDQEIPGNNIAKLHNIQARINQGPVRGMLADVHNVISNQHSIHNHTNAMLRSVHKSDSVLIFL